MKKLLIFTIFISNLSIIFGQHACYMDSPTSNFESSIANGITFYSEEACEPLVLNVHFVFFRRDDGSGTFQENSEEVNNLITEINNKLASIKNNSNCYTGEYPIDSKIRLDVSVNYINDSSLFDWYQKAVNLGSSYNPTAFCPSSISDKWPEIYSAIDSYNTSNPSSFNIFFVENNDLLSHIENAINNGETDSNHTPWVDQNNIDIFSGCSSLANSYNSNNNEWVLQINYHTEHLLRKHFGNTYYGPGSATNEEILGWETDDYESLIIHEMGHSIMDQGHTCGCDNIMIGAGCNPSYVGNKQSLNYNQLENLHKTLSTSNNHKYVNCENLSESSCDFYVKQNTTISQPMSVWGDLIIEENVTLTINSQIYLSKYSEIIVNRKGKLIIDGGLLTSGCDVSWKGIKAYGGNSDFDVKFTNGAVIENTSEAAVSMFAPEPWPAVQNYGNGILHADNTTFNNTARIVELISWSPLPNPSYVVNCVQNGGKWSITNWNCQGIQIKNNVFNNISNECVVTDGGSILIEGNEFNSGRSDILYNNTSAGISSIVKENTFNGLNIGYNARGTTYAQNLIHNNNFYTGEIDVINDGHNQYELYENSINATFGSASFDNGGGIADVHNNDFSGNLAGTLPTGVNDDYNFYLNCYSTTFTDNYIDGNVSLLIHNNGKAANNCFTHSGNNNSNVDDIGGIPAPFTYLEPADIVVNCSDAILAPLAVNRVKNGPFIDANCGSDLPGGGTTEWNYCFPDRFIYGDVFYAYNWQRDKIKEIEKNPYLNQAQKDQLLAIYYRCFKRVRGYLFEWYLKDGKFNEARLLFADDDSDDARVFIFSSYIAENDLIAASNYLDTIENLGSRSVQLDDFIALQRINLSRIPYGPFYNASTAELERVKSIAYKTHPYAGFGKALHYVLTGETISSEIPPVLRNEITPRSEDRSISANNVFRVYPNPFNTTLNVEVSGYNKIDVVVYDYLGKMVYKNSTNQSIQSISTEAWNDGMYIINVKSEGKIVFKDKVVLIH